MPFRTAKDWEPDDRFERIEVIDAHTEGEPLRIILEGFPQPLGATVLERRRDARERLDRYRRSLMFEPRGHADMYGCLLMPPVTEMADFSVLFLHNEGYSTMCGHGVLAVTNVALETGIVPLSGEGGTDHKGRTEEIVRIDTPAGLITARAWHRAGRVEKVRFQNVPSWVVALDQRIDVPGIGPVRYDLAFGGAFYAYVDASALGLSLQPDQSRRLIDAGMRIKRAVADAFPLHHPDSEDLAFLYGTIITSPPEHPGHHARNVCIFANGELDRSPTGTGVSGRAALMHARGSLDVGQSVMIESILGTTFSVGILSTRDVGNRTVIVPEVGGRSWITARSTCLLDPNDPLRDGFIIQ